jgi:hypothetical protein
MWKYCIGYIWEGRNHLGDIGVDERIRRIKK